MVEEVATKTTLFECHAGEHLKLNKVAIFDAIQNPIHSKDLIASVTFWEVDEDGKLIHDPSTGKYKHRTITEHITHIKLGVKKVDKIHSELP